MEEHGYFWVIGISGGGREASLYLKLFAPDRGAGVLRVEMVLDPDLALRFASEEGALAADREIRSYERIEVEGHIEPCVTKVLRMGCCDGCDERKAA